MDDLNALFGSQEKDNDLFEKLVKLLDRQTDHKMSPNVLFGFMGMFNLMSIMSLVKGNMDAGFKQVTGQEDTGEAKATEQSVMNSLTSLLNSASGSGSGSGIGSGQPDLLGLLGNVASKKKINPGLLLSLMSMLNQNKSSQQASSSNNESAVTRTQQTGPETEVTAEKKSPEVKREVELKYDRKKG